MAAHHQHQQLLEGKSSSSTSFSYSDVVPHHLGVTHLQNFDSNPEIYNLNSGIEMIGFQPKPQNLMGLTPQEQQQQEMGFMDDSSLRPCVFPCEGNERPSQGLSLSLSSSNPSTISLQSFELRNNHPFHHQRFNLSSLSSNSRDGFLGKSQSFHHQQEQQQQEAFLMKSVVGGGTCSGGSNMSMQFEVMRNSKYIRPAQELLNEFCNLGTKHNDDDSIRKKQQSKKNKEKWEFEDGEDDGNHNRNTNNNNNNNNNASSSSSSSLYGVSLLELQKRKTKLLGMLEELDRRYKHYCEQMKEVVSSFEAAAGPGAAEIYTVLASRAMSRHFRCLRDTIVAQIKATKKAMGEKDSTNNTTVLGTTRGETPRLRLLDQNLRQQRAYHQMTMMESHPWRPQRGLPERSVSILRAWLFEHFLHPYPSDVDKHILARQTGLTRSQVSNWFINARVRLWKPMVEQMYVEETKEEQDKNMGSSSDGTDHEPSTDHLGGLIDQPLPPPPPPHDQKPDRDQLIRIDPDSLSSILNNTATIDTSSRIDPQNRMSNLHLQQNGQFVGRVEGFGSMDHLDFPSSSSYNQQHHAAAYVTTVQNDNSTPHQGFGGGNGNGGGNHVSLTLGLQQHGGNGVSLAFSPASQAAASLFYSRDHMNEHQYSLLDEEHGQNTLPYRNLMGAQVLHDLA